MQRMTPRQIARLALLALGLGTLGGAGAWPGSDRPQDRQDHPTLVDQVRQHGLRGALLPLEAGPPPAAQQPAEPRLAELLVRHRQMAGTVLLGDLPGGEHDPAIDHRLRLVHNAPEPIRQH